MSITLDEDEILIKNMLLIEKQTRLKDFDGYETTFEISRGGTYEVLYLMKNNKSLVHISEYHLSNYKQLKCSVENNLNYLGYVSFNYLLIGDDINRKNSLSIFQFGLKSR